MNEGGSGPARYMNDLETHVCITYISTQRSFLDGKQSYFTGTVEFSQGIYVMKIGDFASDRIHPVSPHLSSARLGYVTTTGRGEWSRAVRAWWEESSEIVFWVVTPWVATSSTYILTLRYQKGTKENTREPARLRRPQKTDVHWPEVIYVSCMVSTGHLRPQEQRVKACSCPKGRGIVLFVSFPTENKTSPGIP